MTKVVVLGAGSPTPTSSRFGTAFVVQVGGDHLMFDCGPAATFKLAQVGLLPTQIDHLYFTHHHFDHDIDYPCFLLTRWDQSIGDEPELEVRGPAPTRLLTDRLIDEEYGAFSHDWLARIGFSSHLQTHVARGGSLPRKPPSVMAADIGPGLVNEKDGWRVTAAVADHVQPYLDSLAYRLDTPDGSIVFTGDTEPCESVIELARDADMLIAMCSGREGEAKLPGLFDGCCGTSGAGQMARDASVRRLVLTHIGPDLAEPGERERGVADVARIYDGSIILADELMSIEL